MRKIYDVVLVAKFLHKFCWWCVKICFYFLHLLELLFAGFEKQRLSAKSGYILTKAYLFALVSPLELLPKTNTRTITWEWPVNRWSLFAPDKSNPKMKS